MLKILVSLFFISSGSLSFDAGTDSESSANSSSNSNDKTTNAIDVNVEFQRAKKLIYKKKYEKGLETLQSIEEETPFGYTSADL